MKYSLLIIITAVLCSSASEAAVIYNNLTGTPAASPTNGQPLNSNGAAVAFTPTTDSYFFTSVSFTASLFSAFSTNTIIVDLETDAGGLPSGTVLESFTVTGQMGLLNDLPSVIEADSVLNPVLFQGSQYWIVLAETNGSDLGDLVWNYNNSSPTPVYGLTAVYQFNSFDQKDEWVSQGTSNYLAGGLLVQGTIDPLPEPGTLLTFLPGLICIFALKRHWG
jgi:hypothetical protein